MENVPITFDYDGRKYQGEFTPVFGAGSENWHLMIDRYYMGQLTLREGNFVFLGNRFQEMGEQFGHVLISFCQ